MKLDNRKPTAPSTSPTPADIPAPQNYIYKPRDPEESRFVTTLMQAGEQVADLWREPQEIPDAPVAASASESPLLTVEDTDSLMEMFTEMRQWIAAEPHRAQLLDNLRDALGSGEQLHVIFRHLFPQQASQPVLDRDGKHILSKREVEVLHKLAGDRSRQQIAEELGISQYGVTSHLDNIYAKLGVHRPMHAVARAITLNYLDMNVFDLIGEASSATVGNMTLAGTFLGAAGNNVQNLPKGQEVQNLAMCGLLLFILSAEGGRQLFDDHYMQLRLGRTKITQIDTQGDIVHSFPVSPTLIAESIAIAPPHARTQGFTPGNLYVACALPRQGNLNDHVIAEFTPQGEYRGGFCGGQNVNTRLQGFAPSMVFGPDGRLLVASGWLTDGILAFSEGGRGVVRFAEGSCMQIAVHGNRVYGVQGSGVGSVIKIWTSEGKELSQIAPTKAGTGYNGLALSSRGQIFVNFVNHAGPHNSVIKKYSLDDLPLQTEQKDIPEQAPTTTDIDNGRLAMDSQDRLIVFSRDRRAIKFITPTGDVEQSLPLRNECSSRIITPDAGGHLWLCLAVE